MMELLNDKKFLLMLGMFVLLLAGVVFYGKFAGLLLLLALMVYGFLCLSWKETNLKLAGLAFLVLLSLASIGVNHMKYGIDFSGGTRIPVVLERPVDTATMDEMVQTIKKRANVLGLMEVKVRAVGTSQINVEIPSGDPDDIAFIEDTLTRQGVYWGVIDGQVAISGENIFSSSITPLNAQQLGGRSDWGVSFSVDRTGAENFGKVAKGKAEYPVYMFLDRPTDAVLFLSRAELRKGMPDDGSERECLAALREALKLDGGRNISVYITDDIRENTTLSPKSNRTKAIIYSGAPQALLTRLNSSGFVLAEAAEDAISPSYNRSTSGVLVVSKLEAAGLMSAPFLAPELAAGDPAYQMSINGAVPGAVSPAEKSAAADANVKRIMSVLKGGSLPVQISLGSRTTLPASLGSEFLRLSLIGIAAALLMISVFIGLRYRNLRATLPIIAISVSELVILLAILGAFTIDLAAMAGILAAIGVGVDAQIVITDELLKKDEERTEEKIQHAFAIIKTNVIVATLSMVPLLFSGLVEVIGFATSTILGAALGYLLSRPAYAAIVGMIVGKHDGK